VVLRECFCGLLDCFFSVLFVGGDTLSGLFIKLLAGIGFSD